MFKTTTNSRLSLLSALIIMAVATIVGGCNRHTAYSHFEPIGSEGWSDRRMMLFSVGPMRQSGLYFQNVAIRFNDNYAYTNLALIVEQRLKPSNRYYCDTLIVNVPDARKHKLLAEVNHHKLHFIHLPIILLPKGEQMIVTVRQFMKDPMLKGIEDVGFTLKLRDEK